MQGLIGKKVGMTSIFDENGKNIPCTVLQAGPCVVTQIKTVDKDGYFAVQLGFDDKKEKHTTKSLQGHFKKSGATPKRVLQEIRVEDTAPYQVGQTLTVENLKDVTWVDVCGTTKGKGFQGVVKRHGFGGVGMATHGQHNRLRAPGSLGASSWPSRVFKGMRMAGQTGNVRVKVQNLEVLKVYPEQNLIVVKGSVPGAKGSFVIVDK